MDELKELQSRWKDEVCRGKESVFLNFLVNYMCIDAWMTNKLGYARDEDKLKRAYVVDKGFRCFSGSSYMPEEALNEIMEIGVVRDTRPGSQMTIDAIDSWSVLSFIYQVRCNLFHGNKDPLNADDKRKVEVSNKILEEWIAYIAR